jgi:predicted Ser/Thr protein kinase
MLEKVYRPVSTRLLGMELPVRQSHPKLKERQSQLRWALQYGSGALVFFAFWFSIPAALRRGERIASSHEEKADGLLGSTPSESVLLYRNALTFTTDGEQINTLREKLDALDRSVSNGAPADATVPMRLPKKKAKKTKKRKATAPADPGQRYAIERELGRGSMGVVLLARDTVLERKVAIKELPHAVANDPHLLERFQREAKALARLNHPGIVQVYDFAQFQGSSWIVMEYVEGKELEELSAKAGVMEPAEVVRLGKLMAEALQYAHDRGVLHRDLKPANVLVDAQGQPKVMDFGVARLAMSGAHTQPGTLLGSPSYMSPEQARGKEVDQRTDVYALGAILYGLIAGERMFSGTVEEVIAQVLGQPPVPIRRVVKKTPLRLAKLVMSMVAKNQKERPDSMAAVLDELEQMRIR